MVQLLETSRPYDREIPLTILYLIWYYSAAQLAKLVLSTTRARRCHQLKPPDGEVFAFSK